MNSETPTSFDIKVLRAAFEKVWKSRKTRAGKDALLLSAEYLRLFTAEAINRAAIVSKEGTRSNTPQLRVSHLEEVVPQLKRDF
ncbi:7097_t:CDS:2 [Acaulospora morrowiae]|uniref:7097_t:CDS:1 n=1 Tax=Acaulospora morrowiae TaxID=94023 RepID=A0A9N8WPX3_9GLOM|nr:7097_t:CDS:2 [Acaulospora morrowiae]